MAKYKIREISPNRFRHLDRYPIKRDKVEALRKSYRETGFWDNIVARVRDGKPEIAYGHHRMIALQEEYGFDHKIELIVRELDDEFMLKMMANENMEEWGTSATVELETVSAVVEAYGDGLVELPPPSDATNKSDIRDAPSYTPGGYASQPRGARPYTPTTVAAFLGWDRRKVGYILNAHQFIEESILSREDFDELTTRQAEAVVMRANQGKADRERAAKLAQDAAARAKREAEEAEKRQAEAEKRRKEQEAKAAKERDERKKREAEEQARRAAEEAKRQEELRKMAAKRQAAQEKREKEERKQAKRQATSEGRDASKKMKSGEEGYKQASKSKGGRVRTDKKLPDIEEYVRGAAATLNAFLNRDELANGLNLLTENKDYIRPSSLEDLIKELRLLSARADSFAVKFSATSSNNFKADAQVSRSAIAGR
jgi:hypothetical protein